MPDEPKSPPGPTRHPFVERLMIEAGLTEYEATQLVALLGTDWASLVREAKLLHKKR